MLSPVGILYIYGFWVALPLTCLAAALWGRGPERSVAFFYLVALLATIWVHSEHAKTFVQVDMGIVAVDLALLAGLVLVAHTSGRGWLIWATSFHAIAVLGHLAKLIRPEMSRLAYGLMEGASGWPTLLALMWGIWQCRRTRRDFAKRSWGSFFRASKASTTQPPRKRSSAISDR